jgi:hypothetical protein
MPRNKQTQLSTSARVLRGVHSSIGAFEFGCLSYLWFFAISRRRDRAFALAVSVIVGEGVALALAKECPLGAFQRRVGDDIPMFELWFGARLAPYAIPSFSALAVIGLVTALARPPLHASEEVITRMGSPGNATPSVILRDGHSGEWQTASTLLSRLSRPRRRSRRGTTPPPVSSPRGRAIAHPAQP